MQEKGCARWAPFRVLDEGRVPSLGTAPAASCSGECNGRQPLAFPRPGPPEQARPRFAAVLGALTGD